MHNPSRIACCIHLVVSHCVSDFILERNVNRRASNWIEIVFSERKDCIIFISTFWKGWPEEARSADDGHSSGNGGPACPPTFAHSDQFSQISFYQPKKQFIIRIKGFPLADKFVLADKLLFWLIKWDFVKTGRCERRWVGTPGRRCRCGGRRRREAPTTAGAAATAARRAHPPSLTATSFHKISFYSAKKAIYSAKTNLLSQRKPLYAYDMHF